MANFGYNERNLKELHLNSLNFTSSDLKLLTFMEINKPAKFRGV